MATTTMLLQLAGCGGQRGHSGAAVEPASSPTVSPPAVSPNAVSPNTLPSGLLRSVGQGCSWQHGLTVTVAAVRRNDAASGGSGRAAFSVDVQVANRTPLGYAGAALTVSLWSGPKSIAATGAYTQALGQGLDVVVAPGQSASGTYGFWMPLADASDAVAVSVRPSPVDEWCVFRATATPAR